MLTYKYFKDKIIPGKYILFKISTLYSESIVIDINNITIWYSDVFPTKNIGFNQGYYYEEILEKEWYKACKIFYKNLKKLNKLKLWI